MFISTDHSDFRRGLPVFRRHLMAMVRALSLGAMIIGWVLSLWLMVVDETLSVRQSDAPIGLAGATVIWVLLSAVLVYRHVVRLGRESRYFHETL